MQLGKYFKVPIDNKRYTISYADWLDQGETVSSVAFSVLPQDGSPLVISGNVVNPTSDGIIYYAGAGLAGKTYTAYATMTTSGGQVREDTILFTVKAP